MDMFTEKTENIERTAKAAACIGGSNVKCDERCFLYQNGSCSYNIKAFTNESNKFLHEYLRLIKNNEIIK